MVPRGLDPTGRVGRISSRWRFNDPPDFYKRIENNETVFCNGNSFTTGDFVKVVARLDLIRILHDYSRDDKVEMGLALESVTRLFSASELGVRT